MVNKKELEKGLKTSFEVPDDSVELIESFLLKIQVEADILRDALITRSPKSKTIKTISIEPIYEILSILKNSQLMNKRSNKSLDDTIESSSNKLKTFKSI